MDLRKLSSDEQHQSLGRVEILNPLANRQLKRFTISYVSYYKRTPKKLTKIFKFAGRGFETIPDVDAKFLANRFNGAVHFSFKVSGVVDNIEVRVSNPCGCGFVI